MNRITSYNVCYTKLLRNPNEDAHFVRPKPSFALDLRRADAFVTTGLDLELWVPTLLDRAGNTQVISYNFV